MRRFFCNESCKNDNIITLTGDEHNHLAFVLRQRVGEEIIICFNDGKEYVCKIVSISKTETKCEIELVRQENNETKCNVTLFQDLIKLDNMDLIIQKAVELGAKKIIPFSSEYCQIKKERFNLERARKIAKEASKQCERAVICEVCEPVSFEKMLNCVSAFDSVIFANERCKNGSINEGNLGENIALIVGCEGGFSETEKQKIIESGAKSVTLGKRILKAETASVSALTLVMHAKGEM